MEKPNNFFQELEQKLEALGEICQEESHHVHDLKSKVMLQTCAEVLGGLKKAVEDSLAVKDEEDEHVFSPKGNDPWD